MEEQENQIIPSETVSGDVLEADQIDIPGNWDRDALEEEIYKNQKCKNKFKGLTLRQKEFCKYYVLLGFKTTEAVLKAHEGHHIGRGHASNIGYRSLKDPRFRLEILKVMEKAAIKSEVTPEWLLLTCKRLAEEGNSKALEICKDWIGISTKTESRVTSIDTEEARERVRKFLVRRDIRNTYPVVIKSTATPQAVPQLS